MPTAQVSATLSGQGPSIGTNKSPSRLGQRFGNPILDPGGVLKHETTYKAKANFGPGLQHLMTSLHIFAYFCINVGRFKMFLPSFHCWLSHANSCYLVDLRRGLRLRTVCDAFSTQAADSALYASLALMALWQRCFFFHEVFPCFFSFPNGLEIANLRVHRMWLNICIHLLFSSLFMFPLLFLCG